jgi:hypothetical protein
VLSNVQIKTCLGFLAVSLVTSCAYDRRSTFLYPVTSASMKTPPNQPQNLWSVTIVSGQVASRKPSGLNWDDDDSRPDPLVRLYVYNRLVWESPVVEDSLKPQWNLVLPRNITIGPNTPFRIEMWDHDTPPSLDPIGRLQRIGLPPTAQPNAVARLMLDTGAVLTVIVAPPKFHKGVGITWFEIRPSALIALEVEKYSPAGRAGITAGDQIMAIDSRSVESLGDSQACSLLSLASERGYPLEVIDSRGHRRSVKLDRDFIWLTM